jgi:hypothetical protein
VGCAGRDEGHQKAEDDSPRGDPVWVRAEAIRRGPARPIPPDDGIGHARRRQVGRLVELTGWSAGDRLSADPDGAAWILVGTLGSTPLERLAQMLDFGPPSTTVDLDLGHAVSFWIHRSRPHGRNSADAKSYLLKKENAWICGRIAGRCGIAFHKRGPGYP